MMAVLTKSDFVSRYQQGEFGNKSPTWLTLADFLESEQQYDDKAVFHLRNRTPGGETYYDLSPVSLIHTWSIQNNKDTGWYCSQMCPTDHTLIQGEVMRSEYGLSLYYSTVRQPMRIALALQSRQVFGIMANVLLQHYMCPNSWEWLNHLLDEYQGHVVEFTTLDLQWGSVKGYNTLFWEVRLY